MPQALCLASAGQKHCLSNAEVDLPGQGMGTVCVGNNKIQQQLYREKVSKVQNQA